MNLCDVDHGSIICLNAAGDAEESVFLEERKHNPLQLQILLLDKTHSVLACIIALMLLHVLYAA